MCRACIICLSIFSFMENRFLSHIFYPGYSFPSSLYPAQLLLPPLSSRSIPFPSLIRKQIGMTGHIQGGIFLVSSIPSDYHTLSASSPAGFPKAQREGIDGCIPLRAESDQLEMGTQRKRRLQEVFWHRTGDETGELDLRTWFLAWVACGFPGNVCWSLSLGKWIQTVYKRLWWTH